MRKLKIFILSGLIICCLSALAALTACSTTVETPLNVSIDSDTLVLSWDSVSGAEGYTVSVDGDLNYTLSTTYDLTYLEAGTYSIRVLASDGAYESSWSEAVTFTRESENGLIYSLINNNTEYEVASIGTATGDIEVPETFRGKNVTAIGSKAFKNKTKISSITLTNNITSIGEQAFYGCSYLTAVYTTDGTTKTSGLPAGLTEIASEAFYQCTSLVMDLVIPDAITEISEYAFYNCQSLTGLTIGSNVTSIETYAFWKCNGLTEIIIPDNVTSLGDKAFANCAGATYIEIGDGVTSMGTYVFQYCTSLKDVSVGSGMYYVPEGTFAYCQSVDFTKIVLPDTIRAIDIYAFYYCDYLTDITIGSYVYAIYGNAFTNTAAAKAATEAGEMFYLYNATGDVCWLIEANASGLQYIATDFETGLMGIAARAFYKNETVNSITLPETIQYIGYRSFYKCTSLISVTLGKSAYWVEEEAFYGCTALTNVYLGEYDGYYRRLGESNFSYIFRYAFAQCTSLKQIQIPETVEYIGAFAFYGTGIWPEDSASTAIYAGTITVGTTTYGSKWLVGSSYLAGSIFSVYLDEDTVGIADYAFALSTSSDLESGLNSIVIPKSVKYIGEAAFYGCGYLQVVIMYNEMTEIPDFLFYDCVNLVCFMYVDDPNATISTDDYKFEIPDTVTSIGNAAFAYCYCLGNLNENKEIVIPSSVQTIGDYAFFACGYIATDEEGNPVVDEETGEMTTYGATSIVFEDNTNLVIGEAAFAYFATLENVTMGDGITELGENAFFGCTYLETVTLSSSLTEIKEKTFYLCSSLTSIVIPDSVQAIGDKAFYKNTSLTNVTLGSGVTSIGDYAFYYCVSLETINFPSSLKSIGTQAFRSCTSLRAIALSCNVEEIGEHAFYGCNKMEVYLETGVDTSAWNEYWNSSYRPVIYNCTLSESGLVTAITISDDMYSYVYSGTTLSGPARAGYVFGGWTTNVGSSVAEYGFGDLSSLENGTVLYIVWKAE